ncbi:MAG: trypsin-like serine protease [Anaerolineales bacterium]|nr:trypsin-like serine protease [Anaerolineales bacterium]
MVRKGAGVGLSGILLLMTLLLATFACNITEGFSTDIPDPNGEPPTLEAEPSEEPGVPVNGNTEELAKATVLILALLGGAQPEDAVWSGSGSILTSEGLILTNAHVIDNRYDDYTYLGVAVLEQSDEPPIMKYMAEVVAVDYGLDLAVIRIISDINGNAITPNLPFVSLGDSDTLDIGDNLRILGYPTIGGNTITFTNGSVSGFTQERGVDGRAWIKTDATIAGGNSGGVAANAQGELIGIPTQVSAGAESEMVVDCRPVADTNRDGLINDEDTCVPIGGFINGLRPVNLALPLIEAALQGDEYAGGIQPSSEPVGGFDLSGISLMNMEFADGVTEDDTPTQLYYALPEGAERLCAFWDYVGMTDGMMWSAIWFVNDEFSESGSFIDVMWDGGAQGNWWICISNEESGLDEGIYELVLEVEGEPVTSDAIFIGGDRIAVDFTLINQSSTNLCFVHLSPSIAQNWGQDELGSEELIEPGFMRTITLASGVYDLRLRDCEGTPILEEFNIEIWEEMDFTVSD